MDTVDETGTPGQEGSLDNGGVPGNDGRQARQARLDTRGAARQPGMYSVSTDAGLTVQEAAHAAGVSERTVRRAIHAHELKVVTIRGPRGREYRITPAALERWQGGDGDTGDDTKSGDG